MAYIHYLIQEQNPELNPELSEDKRRYHSAIEPANLRKYFTIKKNMIVNILNPKNIINN